MAKKKKNKPTLKLPLESLRLRCDELSEQICELEEQRWDVAWEIARRECPVKIGQILYRLRFDRRYVVTVIEAQSLADEKRRVTWALRVAAINNDGTRRKRSRHTRISPREFEENYTVDAPTS